MNATAATANPPDSNVTVWDRYWAAHDRRADFYAQKFHHITCDYAAEIDAFDRTIFGHVKDCGSLLDIGAGNKVTERKLRKLGFQGRIDTLDRVGGNHRYSDLDEVEEKYDAILLLEVIEHLPIATRTEYLDTMIGRLLKPGGVILISTPNADHINAFNRECWTHCQAVPMRDLFCFFDAVQFKTELYLVKILPSTRGPLRALKERIRRTVYKVICYFLYTNPEERILVAATRDADRER